MNARTAWLLIGVLSLVCFGLSLSAIYPSDMAEPHAANPPDERFTVEDADEYHVTARLAADGETVLGLEGVVSADGERYRSFREPSARSEQFQAGPDAPVYERIAPDRNADRLREHVVDDDERALLREERGGDRVAFVTRRNGSDLAEAIPGTASVFVRSLDVPGYEAVEDDATGTIHEPRSGWYGEEEPYRVTGATGEVRTASDSYAVESATVSWEVTTPAGTYAEYALARYLGDATTTYELTYEFDAGPTDVDQPAWVDE